MTSFVSVQGTRPRMSSSRRMLKVTFGVRVFFVVVVLFFYCIDFKTSAKKAI